MHSTLMLGSITWITLLKQASNVGLHGNSAFPVFTLCSCGGQCRQVHTARFSKRLYSYPKLPAHVIISIARKTSFIPPFSLNSSLIRFASIFEPNCHILMSSSIAPSRPYFSSTPVNHRPSKVSQFLEYILITSMRVSFGSFFNSFIPG